jgi:hypothetical protein
MSIAELESANRALRGQIAGLIQANADLQAKVTHLEGLARFLAGIIEARERIITELAADLPPGMPLVPPL